MRSRPQLVARVTVMHETRPASYISTTISHHSTAIDDNSISRATLTLRQTKGYITSHRPLHAYSTALLASTTNVHARIHAAWAEPPGDFTSILGADKTIANLRPLQNLSRRPPDLDIDSFIFSASLKVDRDLTLSGAFGFDSPVRQSPSSILDLRSG